MLSCCAPAMRFRRVLTVCVWSLNSPPFCNDFGLVSFSTKHTAFFLASHNTLIPTHCETSISGSLDPAFLLGCNPSPALLGRGWLVGDRTTAL